ncbi:MAG: C40 family peptidase [Oscillospiraceae bacterium]|nr:C40 family peptidase [Oscillospiraceae bacterium]
MKQKFVAREKVGQKMTRDGLVTENKSSGEVKRISDRQADVKLNRTNKAGGNLQTGDNPSATPGSKRKQSFQLSDKKAVAETKTTPSSSNPGIKADIPQAAGVPVSSEATGHHHKLQYKTTDSALNQKTPVTEKITDRTQQSRQFASEPVPAHKAYSQTTPVSEQSASKLRDKSLRSENTASSPEPVNNIDIQKPITGFKTDKGPETTQATPKAAPGKTDNVRNADRGNKLKFAKDEATPSNPKKKQSQAERNQAKADRKYDKAEFKAERNVKKLEKAQKNLPSKKKLKRTRVFNEKTGKGKTKLKFVDTPLTQKQHMKSSVITRPGKLALNTAIAYGHKKIFEVERENVGIKAAHRGEMMVEGGVRTALRFKKMAKYRKVRKLERVVSKNRINQAYRKAIKQNPKLQRNPFARALQKRKIKKAYAKAAREARKAAKKAKKAGSLLNRIGKAITGFIKRHPFIAIIAVVIIILLIQVSSLANTGGNVAGSSITSIVLTTYLAADADMLAAEAAYSTMENSLQDMLDNYETLNPGYDEYIFELDSIWHDPYVLMSILHAMHELEWTLSEVQGTLAMLFDKQYILTETVTVEIRTKTETVKEIITMIDPDTGDKYEEEYEYTVEVEYEYKIITVELENFDLSHLPVYIMSEEKLSRYAALMMTLGNRPDLFPVGTYPNASISLEYGKYTIPPEYFGDAKFAEIIAEAEKYLGYPYVWGGSNPSTSFDCSGFVSYVYNQTGWNFGRLTASGLHSLSTPVSPANAKPGDLVFFYGTYKAPNPLMATHVGIYVGNGMMLHCGKPIGYASIETPYFQKHFLGFGRL